MKMDDAVIWRQKQEKERQDTRPCASCPYDRKCTVKNCSEWMGWFHVQWQGIQKAGGVR